MYYYIFSFRMQYEMGQIKNTVQHIPNLLPWLRTILASRPTPIPHSRAPLKYPFTSAPAPKGPNLTRDLDPPPKNERYPSNLVPLPTKRRGSQNKEVPRMTPRCSAFPG